MHKIKYDTLPKVSNACQQRSWLAGDKLPLKIESVGRGRGGFAFGRRCIPANLALFLESSCLSGLQILRFALCSCGFWLRCIPGTPSLILVEACLNCLNVLSVALYSIRISRKDMVLSCDSWRP